MPQDLQAASEQVRHGNNLAFQHRAPPATFTSRLAGLVWENASSGTGAIRGMTAVQRHAELLYAETLFAKVRFLKQSSDCICLWTIRLCWASCAQEIGSLFSPKRKFVVCLSSGR